MRKSKPKSLALDTKLVPQADDLETVFRVVDLTTTGVELKPELLGIVRRQVLYYSEAAKVLGFLDDDGEPTPVGWRCVSASAEERLSLAREQLERSVCGAAWVRWAGKRSLAEVSPESAEEFLRSMTPLAASTAERRAKTLRTWAERLWPRRTMVRSSRAVGGRRRA